MVSPLPSLMSTSTPSTLLQWKHWIRDPQRHPNRLQRERLSGHLRRPIPNGAMNSPSAFPPSNRSGTSLPAPPTQPGPCGSRTRSPAAPCRAGRRSRRPCSPRTTRAGIKMGTVLQMDTHDFSLFIWRSIPSLCGSSSGAAGCGASWRCRCATSVSKGAAGYRRSVSAMLRYIGE